LLKQPAAAVPDLTLLADILDIQLLRTESEDSGLIDELQTVLLTEVQDLLLGWCHDIDFLDRMSHTFSDALQTKGQDMKVFGNDGYHHVNGFLGRFQIRKPPP
jgi:hypothetical protein